MRSTFLRAIISTVLFLMAAWLAGATWWGFWFTLYTLTDFFTGGRNEMNFIAKRFLFIDETKTETTAIQKNFRNFETARAWIQGNTDCNAAGGSIMDAETWGVVFEIGFDGSQEDYRK